MLVIVRSVVLTWGGDQFGERRGLQVMAVHIYRNGVRLAEVIHRRSHAATGFQAMLQVDQRNLLKPRGEVIAVVLKPPKLYSL